MLNKAQIEKRIGQKIAKVLQEQLAEPIQEIKVEIIRDTIIVRLKNQLPPAEKNFIRDEKSRELFKELKEKLIERVRPFLEAVINEVTGLKIADFHSRFEPESQERIGIFILNEDYEKFFY